ncbi:MAG: cephalosporin hydroxylase family protein [Firmicutes bacterium]|nr:cephalosporin hydroxylase family protein [Bacillota bacterium]
MAGENPIADQFHQMYYNSHVWLNTYWLGIPVQKCPLDLWIYQEIIFESRPDVIIEAGTMNGGGTLYLATLCELVQKGRVISIDIAPQPGLPKHHRIGYLTGSSISGDIYHKVRGMIHPGEQVMVILDSGHHFEHVLTEMRLYSGLVTPGQYLVVEDTNINGHPVLPEFGPGPMEALQHFLAENNQFMVDKSREKFFVTFFPNGFLKRVM